MSPRVPVYAIGAFLPSSACRDGLATERGSRCSMGAIAAIQSMPAVTVSADAPAKLNLTLEVLGRHPDGYHDLRSLVIGVGLCDRVRCRLTAEPGVALDCSDSALSRTDNLVVRAVEALSGHLGRPINAAIGLEKRIPVGGGLGGGSSNAATILRLCDHLLGLGLGVSELASIGANVGSDVPLFFALPAALMTGRGEHAEPVRMAWSGWAVLTFVGEPVSTEAVYRAWRPADGVGAPKDRIDAILSAQSAQTIMPLLSNDLEKAVGRVAPAVAEARQQAQQLGNGPVRITGAGSTLYQLYDERDAAEHAARRMEECNIGKGTVVVAAPIDTDPIHNEE